MVFLNCKTTKISAANMDVGCWLREFFTLIGTTDVIGLGGEMVNEEPDVII